MRLTTAQSYALLEKFEACDKCGRMLGPVRFTCRGEGGVWCSRECRGDAERPLIRKGGRRRKHKTNAERQRAYRHNLTATKPPFSTLETNHLQAQNSHLSWYPLRRDVVVHSK